MTPTPVDPWARHLCPSCGHSHLPASDRAAWDDARYLAQAAEHVVTHAAQSDWRCEDIDTLAHFSAKVLAAMTPTPAPLDVERLARAMDAADVDVFDRDDDPETHAEHLAYARDIAREYARLATEDKP